MLHSDKIEPPNDHHTAVISDSSRKEMFETFQTWALQNYGDSGKTKTVTRRKYDRIVRILSGEEESNTENSKFRFWVKAKGFRLGPLNGESTGARDRILYVPVKHSNDTNFNETAKDYKRVAIVDDFFDIIYGVHVEMDGRGGKHAGQKRTYRAIAETYSFLPREAVTRFLMACSDCQKRMHLGAENHTKVEVNANDIVKGLNGSLIREQPPVIDFSVPITQTYLNHMRNKGYFTDDSFLDDDESASSADSEMSQEGQSPSPMEEQVSPRPETKKDCIATATDNGSVSPSPARVVKPVDVNMEEYFPINMSGVKTPPSPAGSREDKGHPERKRRASDDSLEESSKASEAGTIDDPTKDDDDDDDNDDDEKMLAGTNIDPERLKSFNMFCRLFVDENLDRMVPISKQPKDKIQAILDACDRQFPEFHERARKRIRTYLKSCRRMRRSKEQNGWEPLRPTPPHLTSAAAEAYLAQACENESQNAKRMRMGLEPLPASSMAALNNPLQLPTQPAIQKPTPQPSPPQPAQPQTQASTPVPERHSATAATPSEFIRHQPPSAAPAFRPPPEFHPPFFTNGNGLFRAGFPPGYQHPAHHHPPVLHSPIQPTTVQNGPTDLSMKKQSTKNQLSSSEVATIKQLIAGYRESAAFLYRSADELEQLLLQQN